MTTQQVSELRVVLQQIGITQAMFREAISRFERLAAEAGCRITIDFTADFTDYEGGVTRQDLAKVLDKYKVGR